MAWQRVPESERRKGGKQMDINNWQRMARARLESGKMSEAEWESVCHVLLQASESEGIEVFDEEIEAAWKEKHPEPAGRPSDTAIDAGPLGWMEREQ